MRPRHGARLRACRHDGACFLGILRAPRPHYPRRMPATLGVAVGATATAVAVPMLVGHWMPLGHGLLAQMLAVALWGLAVAAWAALPGPAVVPWRRLRPLLLALGLVA